VDADKAVIPDWSRKPDNGKKSVYVVRVDGYWPELCELTFKSLRWYAQKIGAEFVEITKRRYPDFPPTYEKVQVYDLGKDNAWNILIDADFLIHPLTPDVTKVLNPDEVGVDYGYAANTYLDTRDKYFLRYGENRGIATGLVVTSNMMHDLWTPLEFGWEEARKRVNREFIIDEYCLSRNLAKFGLKYTGLFQSEPENRKKWFIHLGCEEKTVEEKQKVVELTKSTLFDWGLV
jgi:hypothetical protein